MVAVSGEAVEPRRRARIVTQGRPTRTYLIGAEASRLDEQANGSDAVAYDVGRQSFEV